MTGSPLTDELIAGFKLAKVFTDFSSPISSIDFSHDGEACLVACTEDESIQLYDTVQGKSQKMVYSKKYGVGVARFTHRSTNVIYSSTKGDDTIRYLSLHDNAYLRYFKGHEKLVTALEMSPLNDNFLSGAPNDSVRLWDLRSAACEGVMPCPGGNPHIAIDPQGMVFAVSLDSKHIRLYDLKNHAAGPFSVFELADPLRPKCRWSDLKFSPDGRDLLVNEIGSTGRIHLINSFEGTLKATLQLPNFKSKSVEDPKDNYEASFTPDGKYIMACGPDRKIHIWKREDGRLLTSLEGHSGVPRHVRFNPAKQMFASACENLVLVGMP